MQLLWRNEINNNNIIQICQYLYYFCVLSSGMDDMWWHDDIYIQFRPKGPRFSVTYCNTVAFYRISLKYLGEWHVPYLTRVNMMTHWSIISGSMLRFHSSRTSAATYCWQTAGYGYVFGTVLIQFLTKNKKPVDTGNYGLCGSKPAIKKQFDQLIHY